MAPDAKKPSEALHEFHEHLDGCQRCNNQPHNLCEVGARLIADAGASALAWLEKTGQAEPRVLGQALLGWAQCLGLVSSPEGKGHLYKGGTGSCSRCGADKHGPSIADLMVHVANGEPKGRN